MARRNLFQPPPPPTDEVTKDDRPRFPNTGAISGVKSTLKDLSSNAVKEIPVDLIDEDGPKDRLAFSDDEVEALAASLKNHGQQVPIMVRPVSDTPGRYKIVYGRRRLRALKILDQPAKALVRNLSDEEAILAQGQENSQRLDPSFIEKALFAAELVNGDYDQETILDALAIDKPMLSRMTKVSRSIPESVIQIIGPAHGVGRRRWEAMANQARDTNINLGKLAKDLKLSEIPSSDARFSKLSAAVEAGNAKQPAIKQQNSASIISDSGAVLAEVKDTAKTLTLRFPKSDTPEFTEWMRDNAEVQLKRLYEAWKSAQKAGSK